MTNTVPFTPMPAGIKTNAIPTSPLASSLSSVELVSDNEKDAYYFRSLEAHGLSLNENQLEAVRYGTGPLLILAGAGSGKTSVLVARVGYLITVEQVSPKNILLVTFSKKAAEEMKERIELLPGLSRTVTSQMTVGTFHSIFLKILRSQGFRHTILSNEKRQHILLKGILKSLNMQDAYQPETLLEVISFYKSRMIFPEDAPNSSQSERDIKEIYALYEHYKQEQNLLDFDDILVETYKLLMRNKVLLESIQQRFHYVMVDEFQDTNYVQYEIIRLMSAPHDNICCVGDDDQCIYQFRGSDSKIILDFPKEYPNTKKVTLDINYRSNAYIVGLGNEVIKHNALRYSKTLKAITKGEFTPFFVQPLTSEEEAALITKKIINDVKLGIRNYADYAILFRTGSSSRAIFEHLTMANIPFVSHSDANMFYEQTIVKPVLDHLRLALDSSNIKALAGILATLYIPRDKGVEHIEWEHFLNPEKSLFEIVLGLPGLKSFQVKQIETRKTLISQLIQKKPLEAIRAIRTEANYDKYMETDKGMSLTMHKEIIKETLDELEASCKKFATIQEFITFIDEMITKHEAMEQLRKNPQQNAVTLMTIHKSKGLEFPCVYLIGASETILPHSAVTETKGFAELIDEKKKTAVDTSLEEERRLAYVAITRAKHELYVSSPMYHRGKKVGVSRFIIDAFPQIKEGGSSQANVAFRQISKMKEPEKLTEQNTETRMEEVDAWMCRSCKVWKRVNAAENTEKKCPVCKNVMTVGKKQIEVPV